jgi:hypothetical protein
MQQSVSFISILISSAFTTILIAILLLLKKVIRREKINWREGFKIIEPIRELKAGCCDCSWPDETPYIPPGGGTPKDWVTTEYGDNICPKCGKDP